MSLSFSPKYFQSIIWLCELENGTTLREWNDDGTQFLFKDIPKEKLKRFHLIGKIGDTSIDYFFDCKTGIFTVDGREFVFPLAGLDDVNYGEGLIHYKSACTEFVPIQRKTHEYDGFEITGYEMGWKVTFGGMKSQVIFSLPQKVFNAEITFLEIPKTISWKLKL